METFEHWSEGVAPKRFGVPCVMNLDGRTSATGSVCQDGVNEQSLLGGELYKTVHDASEIDSGSVSLLASDN